MEGGTGIAAISPRLGHGACLMQVSDNVHPVPAAFPFPRGTTSIHDAPLLRLRQMLLLWLHLLLLRFTRLRCWLGGLKRRRGSHVAQENEKQEHRQPDTMTNFEAIFRLHRFSKVKVFEKYLKKGNVHTCLITYLSN